jgi:hypothetical protein
MWHSFLDITVLLYTPLSNLQNIVYRVPLPAWNHTASVLAKIHVSLTKQQLPYIL